MKRKPQLGVFESILSGDGFINKLSLPPPQPVQAIQFHHKSTHLNKVLNGNISSVFHFIIIIILIIIIIVIIIIIIIISFCFY